MNETTTPPPGQQPGGFHDGPRVTRDQMKDVSRLRRPRQRVIAGVAAGVARHFDVDPLVVRVVLVALCFFGGAGLLLYAAGWLLLPEDGAEHAPVRLDERSRGVVLVGVVALAALAVLGDTWGLYWFPWPLAVLAVVGWYLYQRSQDQRQRPPGTPAAGAGFRWYQGPDGYHWYGPQPAGPQEPPAPAPDQPTSAASSASPEQEAAPPTPQPEQPAGDVDAPAAYEPTAPYGPPAPSPYAPTSPYAAAPLTAQVPYQAYAPPSYAPTPPAPPAAPLRPRPPLSRPRDPRRRGPLLFGFTLALVALAMGILGTVDLAGVDVIGSAYPALALTVVSVMLLVGAFWGRAGGLVLLALVAAATTVGVAADENWTDERVRHQPTSAAAVRDSYELRGGQLVVDLSRVSDVAALDGRRVKAAIGAGRLEVVVPDDVDVRAHVEVGVGAQRVLGEVEHGGLGLSHSYAATAPGRTDDTPLLRLDLDAGVGEVVVRRAGDLAGSLDSGPRDGDDDPDPSPLSLQHDDRQEALR